MLPRQVIALTRFPQIKPEGCRPFLRPNRGLEGRENGGTALRHVTQLMGLKEIKIIYTGFSKPSYVEENGRYSISAIKTLESICLFLAREVLRAREKRKLAKFSQTRKVYFETHVMGLIMPADTIIDDLQLLGRRHVQVSHVDNPLNNISYNFMLFILEPG